MFDLIAQAVQKWSFRSSVERNVDEDHGVHKSNFFKPGVENGVEVRAEVLVTFMGVALGAKQAPSGLDFNHYQRLNYIWVDSKVMGEGG